MNTPVQAVAWACHAATTIKDAAGDVIAECSGHGRHSADDEQLAAEIVRRINCHDDLLQALIQCRAVLVTAKADIKDKTAQSVLTRRIATASEAIAKTTTTEWTETDQPADGRTGAP